MVRARSDATEDYSTPINPFESVTIIIALGVAELLAGVAWILRGDLKLYWLFSLSARLCCAVEFAGVGMTALLFATDSPWKGQGSPVGAYL